MNTYTNLSSPSPPTAAATKGARARRSLQLTNTKETNAWEGLAIGAVTLARTVSTGSHRLCERSRAGHRGGLPSALRRAFSMRRHPAAAPGKGPDGYYWRIHDMDGDSDGNARDDEEEEEEEEEKKKREQREEGKVVKEDKEAKGRRRRTTTTKKMMTKRGNSIMKACKKLFRV